MVENTEIVAFLFFGFCILEKNWYNRDEVKYREGYMDFFAEEVFLDKSMRKIHEANGYKFLTIPMRVGFDRIRVVLDIKEIDWDKLANAMEREKELHMDALTVKQTVNSEQALLICNGKQPLPWVSDIMIRFSNFTLSINRGNGRSNHDICSLEVFISPLKGYEYLGNFSNNSCEEEQSYVRELIQKIGENYGIYFIKDYADLRQMELNINFKMKRGIVGAIETLGAYQAKLNGFTHSEYKENGGESYLANKETLWRTILSGVFPTGLVSTSTNRIVKIYDKSRETIYSNNKKTKSDVIIKELSKMCRIEYTVKRKEIIGQYCNKKSNLFELTQEDIEGAFRKLSEELLAIPIKDYYREIDDAFAKYLENLDITKDRKWREKFFSRIVEKVNSYGAGIYIVTEDDIYSATSHMSAKTVTSNAKRTANLTIRVFKDMGNKSIRVVQGEKEYKAVLEWLCGIKGEEEQEIYVLCE